MPRDSAVHKYSEATKLSCVYIGGGLLFLVITLALTEPGTPTRWAGKGVALLAVLYAGTTIGHGTYLLVSGASARKTPGVVRNAVLSGVLCIGLGVLVVATVS